MSTNESVLTDVEENSTASHYGSLFAHKLLSTLDHPYLVLKQFATSATQ